MDGDQVPPPPAKQLKPADLIKNSWVEYYSNSFAAWIPAVITDVNQETGQLWLNIRSAPVAEKDAKQLMRRRTNPTPANLDWLRQRVQNKELQIEGKKVFDRYADHASGIACLPYRCLRDISRECNHLFGVAGMISVIQSECFQQHQRVTLDVFLRCFQTHAERIFGVYGDALIAQRAPCHYEDPRRNYEFQYELGKGTYGVVYFAVDPYRNKRAVKQVAKTSVGWSEQGQENPEIENLVAMDHPHIVKLYEWYDHLNNIYLVMDYCNGGELGREIERRRRIRPVQRFEEQYVADLMKQLLSAIAYMHGRGLMHLDIKCDNIMLTSEKMTAAPAQGAENFTLAIADGGRPHVMVIDLGVGLFVRPGNLSAGTTDARGTPYTMAPEIWSLEFTTKADVFSMGVVLFCLLGLICPFPDVPCTTIEALEYWFRRPQAPWERLGPYSDKAVQLCRQMLTHSRQQRPSASDCLGSAFIRGACVDDLQKSQKYQQKMSHISKMPRRSLLYRSVALSIAQHWPSNQYPSAKRIFEHMDTEGHGLLRTEKIAAFLKQFGIKETDAESAANAMALSRKGFVHWTEFLASCIDLGDYRLEPDLRNVFSRADADGDGRLSQREVGTLLAGQHLQGQALRDLFRDLSGSDRQDAFVDWSKFRSHFFTPIIARLPAAPPETAPAKAREEPTFYEQMFEFFDFMEKEAYGLLSGWAGDNEQMPHISQVQVPRGNREHTPVRGQQQAAMLDSQAPAPHGNREHTPVRGQQHASVLNMQAQTPRGNHGHTPAPRTPKQTPGAPQAANPLVRDLMAMGFDKDLAERAARRCSSAEAAIDWIYSNA